MPAQSRGRAACNQCRSRKQKCDERRPICSRCRDLNKPCQWPDLRKRGPAKGYTEALEHRLRETEATLLQLLSAVDTVTLNAAFREGSRSEIIRRRSDLKTDKSELAAHWDQFPLCTAEDVANWANEQNIPLRPSSSRRLRRSNEEFSGQFMASEADNAFHRVPGSLQNPPGSSTAETVDGTAYLPNHNTTTHTSPDQSGLESRDSNQDDSSFYISQEFKEQYLW